METCKAAPRHSARQQTALRKLENAAIVFALVSFFGWCAETLVCYPFCGWQDRGFLTLPLCTIYGTAAILYYYAFGLPQSARFFGVRVFPGGGAFKAALRFVYYFFAAALTAAALEYVTALFFDSVFSLRLWNYERYALNLSGYVSLFNTLLWGALSAAFMGAGFAPLFRLSASLPDRAAAFASASIALALVADYAFNYIFLAVNGYRFALF